MDNLKICTFNCKGFHSAKYEITELCSYHDIICLQEIWLDQDELEILNTFHPSFCGSGVSPVIQEKEFYMGVNMVALPFYGTKLLTSTSLLLTLASTGLLVLKLALQTIVFI